MDLKPVISTIILVISVIHLHDLSYSNVCAQNIGGDVPSLESYILYRQPYGSDVHKNINPNEKVKKSIKVTSEALDHWLENKVGTKTSSHQVKRHKKKAKIKPSNQHKTKMASKSTKAPMTKRPDKSLKTDSVAIEDGTKKANSKVYMNRARNSTYPGKDKASGMKEKSKTLTTKGHEDSIQTLFNQCRNNCNPSASPSREPGTAVPSIPNATKGKSKSLVYSKKPRESSSKGNNSPSSMLSKTTSALGDVATGSMQSNPSKWHSPSAYKGKNADKKPHSNNTSSPVRQKSRVLSRYKTNLPFKKTIHHSDNIGFSQTLDSKCCRGGASYIKLAMRGVSIPGFVTFDPREVLKLGNLTIPCHSHLNDKDGAFTSPLESAHSYIRFVSCDDVCLDYPYFGNAVNACQESGIVQHIVKNGDKLCFGSWDERLNRMAYDRKLPRSLSLFYVPDNSNARSVYVTKIETSCSEPLFPPYIQDMSTDCDTVFTPFIRSEVKLSPASLYVAFLDGVSVDFHRTAMATVNADIRFRYNFDKCNCECIPTCLQQCSDWVKSNCVTNLQDTTTSSATQQCTYISKDGFLPQSNSSRNHIMREVRFHNSMVLKYEELYRTVSNSF